MNTTNTDTQIDRLQPGMRVAVHQKIREGSKERIQIFEGLIIQTKGKNKTIIVRRVVKGYGVEKIFNINSPFISKIVIKKQAKVRRANLGYMRNLQGKSARLKKDKVVNKTFKKPISEDKNIKKEEEIKTVKEDKKEEEPKPKKEENKTTDKVAPEDKKEEKIDEKEIKSKPETKDTKEEKPQS